MVPDSPCLGVSRKDSDFPKAYCMDVSQGSGWLGAKVFSRIELLRPERYLPFMLHKLTSLLHHELWESGRGGRGKESEYWYKKENYTLV
jgi:hypothetical protein